MSLRSWIEKLLNPTPRFRARRGRRPEHRPRRWARPWLEALEARMEPAGVITVMNTSDSPGLGPAGSLRNAIVNSVSGDEIVFKPSLVDQTITLTDQLTITHDLTI